MKMTFRWYGEGRDTITLKQIRQIPGMSGLYDRALGCTYLNGLWEAIDKKAKKEELSCSW